MTTELTRTGGITDDQVALVKRTICAGSTDDELQLFVQTANRLRLDPFARQIFAVKRYVKKENREVMSIQVSIDGFRLVAERSSKYAGQLGPRWTADGKEWVDVWLSAKPPAAAKVGVLRHDFKEPLWAVATWDQYKQETSYGLSPMWAKMGSLMLGKCAESLALRRAFPNDLSGVYSPEEMAQAETADYTPPVPVRESASRIAGTHGDSAGPLEQSTRTASAPASSAGTTTSFSHTAVVGTAKPASSESADLDADWREAPAKPAMAWKPGRAGTAAAVPPTGGPITPAQTVAIHTLLSRVGNITDQKYREQVAVYRQADGTPCAVAEGKGTSKLLSKDQASHLISRLEAKCDRQEQRAGAGVDLDAAVPTTPRVQSASGHGDGGTHRDVPLADLLQTRFTQDDEEGDWLHSLFGVRHAKELDATEQDTALQLLLVLGTDAYDNTVEKARALGRIR